MKKAIAILAVVTVALVGLTSYNTNEDKKGNSNDRLMASIKTTLTSEPVPVGTSGGSKRND